MPKPARSKTLSLLAATSALAIAGCGGDDETTSETTGVSGATGLSGGTPLSEEEFVSQANAICAEANSQIEAVEAPSSTDAQALGVYAQEVLDVAEPLLDQFEALVPPEDLQSDFDAYVALIQEQTELDRQLVVAGEAGDTKEVRSIVEQLNAIDTDPQAEALGLDECARDPEPQG